MKTIHKEAERIAARLGRIPGVAAVALGGSWARGDAHPDSDLDLGIYYDPDNPPTLSALRALAEELDDRHQADLLTDFGGWGPWINGGGWLVVGGQRMDWIYRDLDLVGRVIDECRSGKSKCYYQPGHPHGFHTHIYMGEVHYCLPLIDPKGMLAGLKALTTNYPHPLKRALIDTHLWQANFALDVSRKSAMRGDVFHVSGALFQCVAALVQVIFALNECYCINEKGAIKATEMFALRPLEFADTARDVLAHPGKNPEELRASIERLDHLVEAVQKLC
jgi:predicted nucleotidyltransferase